VSDPWGGWIPKLFLAIAGVLIPAYALVNPPFQVPDEDRHMWRAYSVSEGHWVGTPLTPLPVSFLALHERFAPRFEQVPEKRVVRGEELGRWLRQPLQADVTSAVENPNANIYSFVPYAATAVVFRAGRSLDISPLIEIYAGRLVNGAIYVLLMFLALRLLPDFRILLFVVAVTPMALNQAASFSADCMTLALTAVFTALIFRLAFDERIVVVSRWNGLAVVGVLILLSLCKFNIWLALAALLIPAGKFGSRRGQLAFAGLCVGAACATATVWQRASATALAAFQSARAAEGKLMAANAAFVVHHPIRFGEIALFSNILFSWSWLREFVGFFGWLTIPLHPLLVILYAGGMIFAASTQPVRVALSRFQRRVLDGMVVPTVLSVSVLLWILETDVKTLQQAPLGLVFIEGVQGRYFLPIAFPALVSLSKCRIRPGGWAMAAILTTVVAANAGAVLAIWGTYH